MVKNKKKKKNKNTHYELKHMLKKNKLISRIIQKNKTFMKTQVKYQLMKENSLFSAKIL